MTLLSDTLDIEITDEFIDALAAKLIKMCGSAEAALKLLGEE